MVNSYFSAKFNFTMQAYGRVKNKSDVLFAYTDAFGTHYDLYLIEDSSNIFDNLYRFIRYYISAIFKS